MWEIDSYFSQKPLHLWLPMPEPFSNIPHRWYCRGSILEAGAHPVYLGTRQKSLRTMFRIYNERHGRKARSRGKGAHEVTHTSRPPNTPLPQTWPVARSRRGRGRMGGGEGGDAHSLLWREWSDTGSIRRGIRDSCSLSSGGWTTESTAVGEHHKVEGARGASKGAATRI